MSNDQSTGVIISLIDFQVSDPKNYTTSCDDKIELLKSKMRTNYGYILRPVDSFLELNFKTKNLIKNLKDLGFKKPSPIHRQCISPMMNSKPALDIICEVKFHTEKTIAYSVAIIERIQVMNLEMKNSRSIQALVLVENDQIADGVTEILQKLAGEYGLRIGKFRKENIENMDILVGTPQFIDSCLSSIHSNTLKMLIIDCSFGMFLKYNEETLRILNEYSRSVQVCLFGTPDFFKDNLNVMKMKDLMKSPVSFSIKDDNIEPYYMQGVKHFYIMVEREDWKYETIVDLKEYINDGRFLVFCNTDETAKTLTREWSTTQKSVKSLTEDMDNEERELVRREYLNGTLLNLITTNEFSSINFQNSLIINYDIPYNNEQYYRRIHCFGHYGRKKIVLNFAKKEDIIRVREIEDFFAIPVEECPMNINELV